jgi:DNA ligase (NAD+)
MDIRGLSTSRLLQLLAAGTVADVADLYALSTSDLLSLDGFAARSAEQLIAAIAESRSRPFARVLFALGVRHVGETVAKLLARRFETMEALGAASAAEIEQVDGIGAVIAREVESALRSDALRATVARLTAAGVNMRDARVVAGTALSGCTVVITGTLPTLSRKDAGALVEAHGGKVSGSVSKATTFVVAGAEAGSKLEKATALGIPVLDEAALLQRVASA